MENGLRRGLRDFWRDCGGAGFQWSTVVVGAIVGLLVALNTPNGASAKEQGLYGVAGALGSAFTLGFLVLAWNVLRAPYRQRDEALKAYADDRILRMTVAQEKHRSDLLEQAMKMQRRQEGDKREELLRGALISHFPGIKPLDAKVNQLIKERIAILHRVREKADKAVVKIGLRRESGLLVLDELRGLADGAPSAFDCDWRWEVRAGDVYFVIDEPTVPRGFVSNDRTAREGAQYRILREETLSNDELRRCKDEFSALVRAVASSDDRHLLADVNMHLARAFDPYYKELAKYSLAYELPGHCEFCPELTPLNSDRGARSP